MDIVRTAVIGAGRWGPNLIRNLHDDPRSQLVLVVDMNIDRLKLVSDRFPDVCVSDSVEAALDDPEIDAVVVATPATTHFGIASRVLDSGKHCFVEKPLSTDLNSARELCSKAIDLGLRLAVGHVFLFNPAVNRIDKYLKDGTVGDVRYISMVRTNLGPPGIDVGVTWDLATHDISIANHWLGASAVTASARGGSWISDGLEDTVFATLTYPNGCLVHINVSWLNPVKTRQITLVGSRRMITMDDVHVEEPVKLFDKGIDVGGDAFIDSFGAFRATIRDGDVTIPQIAAGEPLREECINFLDSIISGAQLANPGESALPVIATIEAIEKSIQLGKDVNVEC